MGISWPDNMERLPADGVAGRLRDAARSLGHVLRFMPADAPDYMSDHYRPTEASELATTGAEFTLSKALDQDLSGFGYQDDREL